jgi:esterase FrsA
MAAFSLRGQGLLDDWGNDPVPLLYVNGDQDQHVPADGSRPLKSRPNTVVRLVPNATHCAMRKAQEIVPWSLRWLRDQLARPRPPPGTP